MDEIGKHLALLSARFEKQASAMATDIAACLPGQAWQALSRFCHSLAGRAAMFGHPAIGDAARAIEEGIDAGLAPEHITRLTQALLGHLRALDQGR